MKRLLTFLFIFILSNLAFSQVYQVEKLYESSNYDLFVSNLINVDGNANDTKFNLWGKQKYGTEGSTAHYYEVSYFTGSPQETYDFLNNVLAFGQKFSDQKNMLVYISGVKVKYAGERNNRNTLYVYDKEQKVSFEITIRRLQNLLKDFVEYCQSKNYNIKVQ